MGKDILQKEYKYGGDRASDKIDAAKRLGITTRSVLYFTEIAHRWDTEEKFRYALIYIQKWCEEQGKNVVNLNNSVFRIYDFLGGGHKIQQYVKIEGKEIYIY